MKKKILAVGDIHGRSVWKEINPDLYDYIIFIGDYADSFGVTPVEILHNLKEIVAFKKKYFDKVILLLGNHDISYIYGRPFLCSGYKGEFAYEYEHIFHMDLDLFQVCFEYKNYIFSHAGITNKWVKSYKRDVNAAFKDVKDKFKLKNKTYSLTEKINWLQHTHWGRQLIFSICAVRSKNPYNVGGLLWVDKSISRYDALTGYHQIVGHSNVDDIETWGHGDTSITFIDVLGTRTRFYELEI